jgi:hypothetical protein
LLVLGQSLDDSATLRILTCSIESVVRNLISDESDFLSEAEDSCVGGHIYLSINKL